MIARYCKSLLESQVVGSKILQLEEKSQPTMLLGKIRHFAYHVLVGGFKHFLFSIIYGIILPID